jgi:hypothetical protein
MKLTLNADEIARAVAHYIAKKVGGTTADDFAVTMHWRGRTAVIERIRPPIPVLTDKVDPLNLGSLDGHSHYVNPAMSGIVERGTGRIVGVFTGSDDPFKPLGTLVELSSYHSPKVTK